MSKIKYRGDSSIARIGGSFLIVSLLFFTLFPQVVGRQTAWSVANLRNAKLTLSDSRPNFANTKHTAYFQTTTAIPLSGKIIIDYPTEFNITIDHDAADMSMRYSASADMSGATPCTLGGTPGSGIVGVGVNATDEIITFTLPASGDCAGIPADQYVEITIGDGADSGKDDIANPAKVAGAGIADTYVVAYETQDASSVTLDKATVRVAIIDAVTITAEVQATLSCEVAGVASGIDFGNAYGTAGFTTTATTIPFGILNANQPSQSGQLIKVSTNGAHGFYFAVKHYECNDDGTPGTLCSATVDDIDVFKDGTLQDNSTPAAWFPPSGTAGTEQTYGHIGYGTTDLILDDLNGEGTETRFTGAGFAGLSTTYEAILSHNGPVNGAGTGGDPNGQGYVVYKIEISGLQPAGVYSGTVSYLCTGRY